MILDIRFVGVSANQLLVERIQERFEDELGERVTEIEKAVLEIGVDLQTLHREPPTGRGKIYLANGECLGFHVSSSKLLDLVDEACVQLGRWLKSRRARSLAKFAPARVHNAYANSSTGA